MKNNELQKASLEEALRLLKEQMLQLEEDLRIRRKTARTIKKLLEQWNQKPDLPPLPTILTKTE